MKENKKIASILKSGFAYWLDNMNILKKFQSRKNQKKKRKLVKRNGK